MTTVKRNKNKPRILENTSNEENIYQKSVEYIQSSDQK